LHESWKYFLVAADADGAVLAVRSHPEVDADRVGFCGASEAGWVVPLADSRLSEPVAFTALVDGPAVTTGEEEVWSDAAGEEDEGPLTAEKKAEATQRLEEAGPSGFDPAPYIEQLSTPGLWLYGSADKSMPTDRSVEILLTQLKRAGKDFTIVVFPSARHGLVDTVPTAREAPATLVNWIAKTAKASSVRRMATRAGRDRPVFRSEQNLVAGLNSVPPWRHESGALRDEQLDRVDELFRSAAEGALHVVALHQACTPLCWLRAQALGNRGRTARARRRASTCMTLGRESWWSRRTLGTATGLQYLVSASLRAFRCARSSHAEMSADRPRRRYRGTTTT
jgi:dienelactone hydrolase